jgi:hypothetical protein
MTFRLEGYDTFAGETYSLGTPLGPQGESYDGLKPSYETYGEALADARKRLASLERTQPAASSGGQGTFGIQDRVYIIHPGDQRERVLG